MSMLHIERVFDAPRELGWRASPTRTSSPSGSARSATPCHATPSRPTSASAVDRASRWCPTTRAARPRASRAAPSTELVDFELYATHEDLTGEMAELFGTDRITMRIEFHDEGGTTRLVIDQGPCREDFVGNAREGWGSSFTKLDALLAT